ncbi:nuclear transport factor 2 [Holotrichia oblita]|uniref:Nuclear transport factor 2 n=1 Tax=Holotrichia oblita TaxID=644536 RepID=A0ACB9TTE8_HOLOL|nr:nuclear transport factor 2 [Holotrichia oblita]
MDKVLRGRVDQACRTAEEFTKLYYESVDKRRHLISRLYLENALLTWNGNGISTSEKIQKFYIDLPSSDHSIITLDSQPILGS